MALDKSSLAQCYNIKLNGLLIKMLTVGNIVVLKVAPVLFVIKVLKKDTVAERMVTVVMVIVLRLR